MCNFLLNDKLLPLLIGDEFKVLSYIIRKTSGFGKSQDRISLSQFVFGTGLSKGVVIRCLNTLIQFRVITSARDGDKTNGGNEYSVNDIDQMDFRGLADRINDKKNKHKNQILKAREARYSGDSQTDSKTEKLGFGDSVTDTQVTVSDTIQESDTKQVSDTKQYPIKDQVIKRCEFSENENSRVNQFPNQTTNKEINMTTDDHSGDVNVSPSNDDYTQLIGAEPLPTDADRERADAEYKRKIVEHKERIAHAFAVGLTRGGADVAQYPEDVRETIRAVCALWGLKPPPYTRSTKGKAARWIVGSRELIDSCSEFGLDLLKDLREDFQNYMNKHGGRAPYTVASPGSLADPARGMAGMIRCAVKEYPEDSRWVARVTSGEMEYFPPEGFIGGDPVFVVPDVPIDPMDVDENYGVHTDEKEYLSEDELDARIVDEDELDGTS